MSEPTVLTSTSQLVRTLDELITDHDTIIVHRHTNPDPDAIGSANGLAHILKLSYPDKTVLVAGKDKADNIDIFDLSVDVPEIEYTNSKSLSIVVDTANADRIDGKHWHKATTTVKIDHHPDYDGEHNYADYNFVNTLASSAAELIVRAVEMTRLCLDESWVLSTGYNIHAAEALYLGLIGDTGNFTFPNTTEDTFRAAATLAEAGVNPPDIRAHLTRMEYKEYKFLGFVHDSTAFDSGIAYTIVTDDILKKYNITAEQAHKYVNSARNIIGVHAWAFFIEDADKGYFRTSLRSHEAVINGLASKYNGGGHPCAAGCRVSSDADIPVFLDELRKIVLDYVCTL